MSQHVYARAHCVDRLIRVSKQTVWMRIVLVEAIPRPAHLVPEQSVSDRMNIVWPQYNCVDLDTYWTVYYITLPESKCAGGRLLTEFYYLTYPLLK
jgi:hypothetical protein